NEHLFSSLPNNLAATQLASLPPGADFPLTQIRWAKGCLRNARQGESVRRTGTQENFTCRARPSLAQGNRAVVLQIRFCPIVHALKRSLDVLDRVRHAETQIAFTEFSERRT